MKRTKRNNKGFSLVELIDHRNCDHGNLSRSFSTTVR